MTCGNYVSQEFHVSTSSVWICLASVCLLSGIQTFENMTDQCASSRLPSSLPRDLVSTPLNSVSEVSGFASCRLGWGTDVPVTHPGVGGTLQDPSVTEEPQETFPDLFRESLLLSSKPTCCLRVHEALLSQPLRS